MRTLLLNDTSEYHHGCREVVESYGITDTVATNDDVFGVRWSDYDRVVLNGEGTMHHDAPNAVKFLRALRAAQEAGCRTEIRNSVWQSMSPAWRDVLLRCARIEVREALSAAEMQRVHGVHPDVAPDRCMLADVTDRYYPRVDIYEGQRFGSKQAAPGHGRPRLDIFTMSWSECVSRLRRCVGCLITGRHHEAYAAIKARCRVIAMPGNTWKCEGIFVSADARPVTDIEQLPDVVAGAYDADFARVFAWAHTHTGSPRSDHR